MNLYAGIKNTKYVVQSKKIEDFFTENNYLSEYQAIHLNELKKSLLLDEDMNNTFFSLVYNKTIKSATKDYYYLDLKARYRPKTMIKFIFAILALAALVLIIFTIIAFANR